jgi:hypothetical protein
MIQSAVVGLEVDLGGMTPLANDDLRRRIVDLASRAAEVLGAKTIYREIVVDERMEIMCWISCLVMEG